MTAYDLPEPGVPNTMVALKGVDDVYPALVPFLLIVESGRQVYRVLIIHKFCFLHEALVLVVEAVVHHIVFQHTTSPYSAHQQADVTGNGAYYICVAHTDVECPPVQKKQYTAYGECYADMPP